MMLTRYAGCEFFSPWRISDDQRIRFEAHERPELAAGDMPRCELGGKPTVARCVAIFGAMLQFVGHRFVPLRDARSSTILYKGFSRASKFSMPAI